ncbi:hypothetical protein EUGRSUZ_D01759, partial [Eucalyptus grandis]
GCKACGREELERGCNGEGRIQGGIATVPGFGWWPIKAYRPCPGFVASGGRYRRQGQSMDEVAFGRGGSASVLEASACFKLGKLLMNSAARKGEIGGNSIDDTFPFTIARQVHNPTGLLGHLESRKRSEGMNAYHLSSS